MSVPPPVDVDDLPGGVEAFTDAVSEALVYAQVMQGREQEHLDAVGRPRDVAFDPARRTVKLRGAVFEAEQLGSYAGTWLWSGELPGTDLPDEALAMVRRLRALPLETGVLRAPHVSGDAIGPHAFGVLAVGHGVATAFHVVYTGANERVFGFVQPFAQRWPTLYEVDRALQGLMGDERLLDAGASIRFAASRLGITLTQTSGSIVLTDGGDTLTVTLDRKGRIAGTEARVTLR